jgi:hypothetical protein
MCKATKTNFSPFFLYWGSRASFFNLSPSFILFGKLLGPTLLVAPRENNPVARHFIVRAATLNDCASTDKDTHVETHV